MSLVAVVSPTGTTATPAPAVPAQGPATSTRRFIDAMNAALSDPAIAERLSATGLVVRIDITDRPGEAVTLLFDRKAPAAVYGAAQEWPAVRLWMTGADLECFYGEDSHLPMRIVAGEIRFEGTVRKLLRVMPIIRRALRDAIAAGH